MTSSTRARRARSSAARSRWRSTRRSSGRGSAMPWSRSDRAERLDVRRAGLARVVRARRRKQADLELAGLRVLRTDWDEVRRRPESLVARVVRVLLEVAPAAA